MAASSCPGGAVVVTTRASFSLSSPAVSPLIRRVPVRANRRSTPCRVMPKSWPSAVRAGETCPRPKVISSRTSRSRATSSLSEVATRSNSATDTRFRSRLNSSLNRPAILSTSRSIFSSRTADASARRGSGERSECAGIPGVCHPGDLRMKSQHFVASQQNVSYTGDMQSNPSPARALKTVEQATCSQGEAAEILGISYAALRSRVWRGQIPRLMIGRTVRIPRAALDEVPS